MNRIGLTLTLLVACTVVIIAGEFVPAFAVDCPHPAVTSATATPTSLIGGSLNYEVTLTFASAIPQGCQHFILPDRDPDGAAANPFFCTSFFGDGTNQKKCPAISQVVDQTQNIALTYQARVSQAGATVGNPASTQVTNTPVALHSFSVSSNQLPQGQTITGTVLRERIVHNTGGSARVNLSASPATAVQIPGSIQISCCTTDGQGHAKGTFTIAAGPVNQDTQVVISASRPNQPAITRTITVKPGIPTLTINDVTVNEPVNSLQAVSATFTLTLSNPNPAGASLSFTTRDVTAVRSATKTCSGSADYVLRGGVLNFTSTQTTQTVSVPICHYTTDEPNETFRIDLSNPVGITLNDTAAIGTIVDND